MKRIRFLYLSAMAIGTMVTAASPSSAQTSADLKFATKTAVCPANSVTPCKLVFSENSDYYTDTISCQWSNAKVSLVLASVLSGPTTVFTVPFALTPEERTARGMFRQVPSIPIPPSNQLQISFQAGNTLANNVTCYVLSY
jgi:hypothetical protein